MPGDAPKSDPCRDMESRDVTESMLFLQVHKMLRSSGSLVLLIDAAACTGTGRRAARWRASYGSALAISSLLSRSWHGNSRCPSPGTRGSPAPVRPHRCTVLVCVTALSALPHPGHVSVRQSQHTQSSAHACGEAGQVRAVPRGTQDLRCNARVRAMVTVPAQGCPGPAMQRTCGMMDAIPAMPHPTLPQSRPRLREAVDEHEGGEGGRGHQPRHVATIPCRPRRQKHRGPDHGVVDHGPTVVEDLGDSSEEPAAELRRGKGGHGTLSHTSPMIDCCPCQPKSGSHVWRCFDGTAQRAEEWRDAAYASQPHAHASLTTMRPWLSTALLRARMTTADSAP